MIRNWDEESNCAGMDGRMYGPALECKFKPTFQNCAKEGPREIFETGNKLPAVGGSKRPQSSERRGAARRRAGSSLLARSLAYYTKLPPSPLPSPAFLFFCVGLFPPLPHILKRTDIFVVVLPLLVRWLRFIRLRCAALLGPETEPLSETAIHIYFSN